MKRRHAVSIAIGVLSLTVAGGIGLAYESKIQSIEQQTVVFDQQTADYNVQTRACPKDLAAYSAAGRSLAALAVLHDFDEAQRTLESTIKDIVQTHAIEFDKIDPGWIPPRGAQVATAGTFSLSSTVPAVKPTPYVPPTPAATTAPAIFATPTAAIAATPAPTAPPGLDGVQFLSSNKVTFTFSGTPAQIVAAAADLAKARTLIKVNAVSFFHDSSSTQPMPVVGAIFTTIYLPKTSGVAPQPQVSCPKPTLAVMPLPR